MLIPHFSFHKTATTLPNISEAQPEITSRLYISILRALNHRNIVRRPSQCDITVKLTTDNKIETAGASWSATHKQNEAILLEILPPLPGARLAELVWHLIKQMGDCEFWQNISPASFISLSPKLDPRIWKRRTRWGLMVWCASLLRKWGTREKRKHKRGEVAERKTQWREKIGAQTWAFKFLQLFAVIYRMLIKVVLSKKVFQNPVVVVLHS